MTLGQKIKEERDRKGWSQIFFARKIGVTNAVLSNYERDVRDPDTTTLKNIANTLEVSVDYLLGLQSSRAPRTSSDFGNDWTDQEKIIAASAVETFRKVNKK